MNGSAPGRGAWGPGRAGALDALAARLGPLARRDVPLGPMTTYRVGGPAALLAVVPDTDALARLAALTPGSGVPVAVVGRGSNLLVADAGFAGLVVVLGAGFAAVEVEGTSMRAGGAAALPVVARHSVGAGLTGMEWAVGVPGSLGGAVRMNAGGHGSDMAAVLAGVRVVDLDSGEDGPVGVADLRLGYRRSAIGPSQVVTEAVLGLRPGDRGRGEGELREIVAWRRAHQPGGANAGSVFANPPGDSAGRLVDAAGCRGLRVGSASVSTKHANFVIADPGGSAADVARLISVVRTRVYEHAGVDLEPENVLLGFDHLPVVEG